MSVFMPEVGVAVVAFVVGWVGLWPVRNHLGAWGYHMAAFPVGMLGWSLGAVVSSLLGRGYDALSAAVGLLLYVVIQWVIATLVARGRPESESRVDVRSYLVAGALFLALVLVFAWSRFTIASGDSWASYWPRAARLSTSGALDAVTLDSAAFRSSHGAPLSSCLVATGPSSSIR